MSQAETITDGAPFIASTGVTINVDGSATVVGAVTLFTKKFIVKGMRSFSLNAQGNGTGTAPAGVNPVTPWRIFAANDYDPTRPVQKPGTFVDVTAFFGAAGVVTPGVAKQFNTAPFSGNGIADQFAASECPWYAVQFQLPQTGGTEIIFGQLFTSEI